MKTQWVLIVALALCLVSVPTSTRADAATVLTLDVPCHFFNGDGVWSLAIGDCHFLIVLNPSGDTAHVTATGVIAPASDGQAAHFDISNTGIPCTAGPFGDLGLFVTDKWQETVSATGEVQIHCQFH